jgi:NADPH-dependent glutamate synthase beta subunit-like oxidoreductase
MQHVLGWVGAGPSGRAPQHLLRHGAQRTGDDGEAADGGGDELDDILLRGVD